MDYPTEHQKYQQYCQQYHQQQQPQQQAAAAVAAPEAYDPSQTQAYHAYHHQQQYQYYHSQDYTTSSYPPQFHQELTSIHPPGVPIPLDPTHLQNNNAYYSHGIVDNNLSQQQSDLTQFSGNPDAPQRGFHRQISQSAHRGGRRKGGRSFRGSGRGHFGQHVPGTDGRGHGQGGGKRVPMRGATSSSAPSASIPGQTPLTLSGQVPGAPSRPPPRMAWCELCRVDCNTPEILEQHKNGKRHKRNLQTHVELQNHNVTGQQKAQTPYSGSQSEVAQPQIVEESGGKQTPQESSPSQALIGNNNNETELQKTTVDSAQELQKKSRDQVDTRRRGFKRKMRESRGSGKYMRTNEGPKRPVEPSKPKEVIPFICELCNVKCESQVVFNSHLAGKKHLANVKRFHGHRALYGEAGLQVLHPPSINTPSSSVIPPVQQGVNDPQIVLAQLLTYVLSQAQAPELLAAQVQGLLVAQMQGVTATVAPAPDPGSRQETRYQPNCQIQGSMGISEEESKNTVMLEADGKQQSVAIQGLEGASIDKKAENEISTSEEKNASLHQDNVVMAPLVKPDMNAGQVLSATASESVASMSKVEVASASKATLQLLGNDHDDSVLENKGKNPGSDNKDDPDLEFEEDPEEDACDDDSMLENEGKNPGSDNEDDPNLEIEEDPEEDACEASKLQNKD